VVDDLAGVQSQINAAMTGYFLEADLFLDGLTIPPRKDRLSISAIIGIVEDIVSASSGTFNTATFKLTSTAIDLGIYILQQGEKAKLGNPVVFV